MHFKIPINKYYKRIATLMEAHRPKKKTTKKAMKTTEKRFGMAMDLDDE
jgi:hypothetical protein